MPYPLSRRAADTEGGAKAARKQDTLDQLQRLFVVAVALTLPVVVLEMGGHLFPAFHHWTARVIGLQTNGMIQFTLTTLVLMAGAAVLCVGHSCAAQRSA